MLHKVSVKFGEVMFMRASTKAIKRYINLMSYYTVFKSPSFKKYRYETTTNAQSSKIEDLHLNF
jgi:hypothetical protein